MLFGKSHEDEAQKLALRLTHLSPPEQKALALSLKDTHNFEILGRAIETCLANTKHIDDETLERVYLFGREMRFVFEHRRNKNLEVIWHWDTLFAGILEAFNGGFSGLPFAETLRKAQLAGERNVSTSTVGLAHELNYAAEVPASSGWLPSWLSRSN